MKGRNTISLLTLIILLFPVFTIQAQADSKSASLIHDAIVSAGGMDSWQRKGTLVVHESQSRNEDDGIVKVNLVHYMNTMGKGYRVELAYPYNNYIYGWDGKEFWAMANGKAGDHELVREARRVISDAYFRFSLPFILDDVGQDAEYTGSDTVDGTATEVVNITYEKGPADRYFAPAAEEHGHNSTQEEAGHGAESEGHGHGGEVYNYHFNSRDQIAKVYFSHHGDGTYETLLFEDFNMVDGINREHKRILLRPDGQTHYESDFTSIEFVNQINDSIYSKP